jgi:histidine triad (HIT) family protein
MHNHAPEDYKCPLCAIAHEEEEKGPLFSPDDMIFSNEHVYAMISAYQWPNNPGNAVVVPNDHFENIYELPNQVATHIHALAKEVAIAMKAAWKCDGISTRQHNEPAGNQDTWHYHFHVTPRYLGDDLYKNYVGSKAVMAAEDRARYASELSAHLESSRLPAG